MLPRPGRAEARSPPLPSSEGSAAHPATGEGTIGKDRQQAGPSRDRKLGTVRTGIGLANLLRFCSLQDAFLEPLQTRWYMGTSGYSTDHLGLYGRVGRGGDTARDLQTQGERESQERQVLGPALKSIRVGRTLANLVEGCLCLGMERKPKG